MSFQSKKEKIFKAIIPYKSSLQSTLTSLMYNFKYQNKGVNIWMEKNSQYIFTNFFDHFLTKYNLEKNNVWESFRFYLKGGKALNKLLRSICNEDKYNILLSDTKQVIKRFDNNKCFVNYELFPSSDTDYDFTLLVKNKRLFPNNDNDLNDYIISTFNSMANYMNNKEDFSEFKKKLLEHINNPKNIKKIRDSLIPTVSDIEARIASENDILVKNYFELKLKQLNYFIVNINKVLRDNTDMFISNNVIISYGTSPISLESSSFYLYRLKLFFELNPKYFFFKKTNVDIKDYLNGNSEITAVPFDNIFAELIDLSLPVGNDAYLDKLWKYTSYQDMLRPISYFQPNVYVKKIYRYPVVSLRHQMNDIVTIFSVEGSTKLPKRCSRFLEFLKMYCYAENVPDKFSIYFSKEIQKELFSQGPNDCKDMLKIVSFLSNKKQIGKDYKIEITKEEMQANFPDYCKNNYNKNFIEKKDIIDKLVILSRDKMGKDIPEENFQKLSSYSLQNLYDKRNTKNFSELLNIVGMIDELERIIPLELLIK